MMGRRFGSLGMGPLAIFATAVLGVSPTPASVSPGKMPPNVALLSDESIVIGPSGDPIPSQSYVDAVNQLYIEHSGFNGYTPNPLNTPEGLYPLTGVKSLPFDTSAAQGQSILDSAIRDQIAAGNNVVVFGYSQSATISSLEMTQLADNPPDNLSPGQLAFVLVGDPSNPNGGMLERFEGLSLPSLGMTFSGATPDDLFPTTIYTLEYDGFADFPRYPLNLVADLNAALGIAYVHTTYAELTPEQVATAIPLPTEGDTLTDYYMIPTENLPLLEPLRSIPVIGKPIADLLQPDLKVLVNLGYGSITDGWDQGPANVPTPFGLWPTDISPTDVWHALETGTQQGINAFVNDLGSLSWSAPPPSDPFAFFETGLLGTVPSPGDGLPSFTEVVNAFTSAAASGYATLLPTADILNTLVTSLPAYQTSLFLDGLEAGNLLAALGNPVAAAFGLASVAALFEFGVIAEAGQAIVNDLSSLFP